MSSLLPPSRRPKQQEIQPDSVKHYAGCPVLDGKAATCRCKEVRESIAHAVDTQDPVVPDLGLITRQQRRAIKSWQRSEERRQRRADRRK